MFNPIPKLWDEYKILLSVTYEESITESSNIDIETVYIYLNPKS